MTKTPGKKLANDAYETASCSAIMGTFLFRDGAKITDDVKLGEPVQFCVGDKKWVTCKNGLPAALVLMNKEIKELDGMSFRDLPEDWGVIANMQGEVTHRAYPGSGIRAIEYLGQDGGELATGPVTIGEIGIAPRARLKPGAGR